jgi:DNA-binding XRE family transcriptional regulator
MSYSPPPVTASGHGHGGRPRQDEPPSNAFAVWLSSQPLTVAAVAEELGVTKWAVYHLRSSYNRPSLELANKIAELSGGQVPSDSWPPANRPAPAKRKPKPRRPAAAKRKPRAVPRKKR